MSVADYLLEPTWKKALANDMQATYFQKLDKFLAKTMKSETVYPAPQDIFNAFSVPMDKVKVVIIGQDPYHGEGQAHGLCFSVQEGTAHPPSLKNIFKEIKSDLGIDCQKGDLSKWKDQGVLLLNSVLTVTKDNAASHEGQGWEIFTDKVISLLNQSKTPIVFMLWGSYAQRKGHMISPHHLVLKSVHPSPLSAYRGFFGCKHFSLANAFLKKLGQKPIDWSV